MIGTRGLLVLVATLATLALNQPARAGAPTDQLRVEIDRVLKILEDPALKADGKTIERRQRVRAVANDIFDWTETARRSLARHWQARSPAEREEFVKLFGDLLERSYISKIESYGGEKIDFLGDSVDGDQAVVRTKIETKQGTEVPVEYRMLRRGDRWLVYDVVIEGVSLVGNYRTQFNKIIQTSSYQELVKKLRTKQEEFDLQERAKQRTSRR
jgi:phospholipid transport system substrate-binding protein